MSAYYMVTLADRDGRDERILVTVPDTDTEDDVRAFVLTPGITGTKGETIDLVNPTVIGLRKLAIKRPVGKTNMAAMTKAVTTA